MTVDGGSTKSHTLTGHSSGEYDVSIVGLSQHFSSEGVELNTISLLGGDIRTTRSRYRGEEDSQCLHLPQYSSLQI